MRQWINKYAYVIIGGIILITILLVLFRGRNHDLIDVKNVKAFYVDDENGEESVLPANQLPPLLGKNGRPTLVKAFKFTTDGGKTVTTAYLQKYSDKALEELKSTPDDDAYKSDVLENGLLIRLPGAGQQWVPMNSPEGQKIRNTPIPGDGPIQQVNPK